MSSVNDIGLRAGCESSTRERVADILDRSAISTCTIVDSLDALGVANTVFDSRLACKSSSTGICFGAAFPVSWAVVRKGNAISAPGPSTWSEVRDFVVPSVVDGRGYFYVAGAGELVTEAALAGGISVTYLIESLRFEGILLGGAVRDRNVIEACTSPVIASNFTPSDTQGSYRVVSVGEKCLVGHTLVSRGDWIFADGNGAVCIPHDLLFPALRGAASIEERESQVVAAVNAGRHLPEVIDEIGQI